MKIEGCLSLDLLILNVALAFFSAIISAFAFSQLVRIHLREKEWTRQKVLHFMIGTSNTGYFIYFVSTQFATCKKWFCWSHICGFVLMGMFLFLAITCMQLQYLFSARGSNDEHTAAAYPKILFLAAFLLLLSFWVDLCHQVDDEEDDDNEHSTQQTLLENTTNKLGSSNTDGYRGCCSFQGLHVGSHQKFVVAVVLLVCIIMISFAVLIWIGTGKNFIDSSIVAQVYEDFIAIAFLLLGAALGCYGLLLFLKLRKVRSERALSEMWKVAGLAVTSVVCFTSSALVAIITDIPLYYHWHLKKMYGVTAVIFLILYYLIGSLVPSAFVLWIMRELPPAITHRQEQTRIITFISHGTSGNNRQRQLPSVTSLKDEAFRASPT